ncbi:MAG: hypothetical protein OHK0017_05120 [Patescibacteria group bacterium]
MSWLIRFVVNVAILLLFGILIPKQFPVTEISTAVWFIIVLTLLNWTLVPIVKLLTLPFNIITLGILGVVINGLAIVLTGSVLQIKIDLLAGILVSVVLGLINGYSEHQGHRNHR